MKAFQYILLAGVMMCGLNCDFSILPPPPPPPYNPLTDATIRPVVLGTTPANGSEGTYIEADAYYIFPIVIKFNKSMDPYSVRRNFKLSGPSGIIHLDTNRIFVYETAHNETAFVSINIDPRDAGGQPMHYFWQVGELYSVDLDTNVTDVNNNHLRVPLHLVFMPEPYFRIRGFEPSANTDTLMKNYPIVLKFNSPVDTAQLSVITFSPPFSGAWRYRYDDQTAVYYSYDQWNDTSTHALTVPTSLHDRANHLLHQQFTTSLNLYPFRVLVSQGFYISFTSRLNPSSATNAYTVDPPVPGYLEVGNSFLHLHPPFTFDLLDSTMYTVTVETTLTSFEGIRLPSRFVDTFTTPAFRILHTSPSDGEITNRMSAVQVTFTARIDTATARSAFTIIPEVSGKLQFNTLIPENYFYFQPDTLLASHTSYIVTILTTMRSRAGGYLSSPYSFSFTTGN